MNEASPPTPRISVIVPAYNAAATLDECLRRLTGNIAPPFEVIVVDDCSTDDTAAIATAHGVRLVQLPTQSGAAVARNVGASHALAETLFFVDADVMVEPDSIAHVLDVLDGDAGLSAMFGSYTAATVHTNFCSVYKNLMHHFTHQDGRPEAKTFWSGAGAIRTAAFWHVGGFNPADTRTADVEDIALGYRLGRAGFRIRLDRTLQVTHAKYYSFLSVIRSDVVHRAIPWTRLMLRERVFQHDLNTSGGGLLSALALFALPLLLVAAALTTLWALLGVVGMLVAYLLLNRRLFLRFARYDRRLLLPAVGMTALYYVCAAFGAGVGVLLYLRQPRATPAIETSPSVWASLVSTPSGRAGIAS